MVEGWTRGPTNSLVDVAGLRVGHHHLVGEGALTGTTVVVGPPEGMVGGVDVRGGGPGTRETEVLGVAAADTPVHAITLTGGSAYGLAAASGVADGLDRDGVGLTVPTAWGAMRVPIVPAAVVFDIGRGGEPRRRPDHAAGLAAYEAASDAAPAQGCVGAGTGAVAGAIKGGVGSASVVLADGTTVAALVVVNAAGSIVDPDTGELYGRRYGLPGEHDGLGVPGPAEVATARATGHLPPLGQAAATALNTTVGVVATDAGLTRPQCTKLAAVAHDGMARAVRPCHSMQDGDTVFGVAIGRRPPVSPAASFGLLAAAADCFARAVVNAALAATSTATPAGTWPAYRDLFPSTLARGDQ